MKKNHLGSVLVLLVFAVFVVSVLLVLLTGADVVQKLNERDQRSYDHRTAFQYLTTRIRQADQKGMVDVRDVNGASVLALGEIIEDEPYETLVYCYDGYLYELFIEAGLEMDLEFGEPVLPLADMRCTKANGCIRIEFTMTDGMKQRMTVALRSEGEVQP